jgi:DNA-binding transcriptional regulator YhcF (GntR family)
MKMEFEYISASEIRALKSVYDNYKEQLDQNQLSLKCGISPYTVSRALNSLESFGYVKRQRCGKHNIWKPGKNRKSEALAMLRVYDSCKQAIEDGSKIVIRVHNREYLFKAFVPTHYDKSLYQKGCPGGDRIVIIRKHTSFIAEFHLRELDSDNNTLQLFLTPFFMILDSTFDTVKLRESILLECNKRIHVIQDRLQEDGTTLREQLATDDGDIAITDDWVARIAIKHGLTSTFVDDSLKNRYGETELPYDQAVIFVPKIFSIRKFCVDNNLIESQFYTMMEAAYRSNTGSPFPIYSQYLFPCYSFSGGSVALGLRN